ncbi:hypothetical protein ACTJK4_22995 [Ralstonia sp. 22111]|uniref:hypothetical protein n=1 Tax=Ralstonia sp. 22111 TaxID=3453878 RepID=UPI003F840AC6
MQLMTSVAENSADYIQCAPQLSLDRFRVCAVLTAQAIKLGAADDAGRVDFFKCAQLLMPESVASSSLLNLIRRGLGERSIVWMARRVFGAEFRLSVLHLLITVSRMYGSWAAFLNAYQAQENTQARSAERRVSRAVHIYF